MSMRRRFMFLIALTAASALTGVWLAVLGLTAGEGGTPGTLEERVRRYLIAHPEVLNEAANAYQARRAAERSANLMKALASVKGRLRDTKGLPALGNPKGDVTVVAFFDYRCPYCKRTWAELDRLIESDAGLRLVLKEFPILGPDSLFASKAAIAAREQGKYPALHRALMSHKGPLGALTVMAIAKDLGLDTDRLRRDMDKPEVKAIIGDSFALASRLEIDATPTMVIGDEVHAGYADLDTLKELVGRARAGCKTC